MTEITIKCGFGKISGLHFRDDIMTKGEDLLTGGHLGDVKEVRHPIPIIPYLNGKISVIGRCVPEASIRKTPYIITLELNPSREVTLAHCSCQAGATGMCKHTYAVYKAVNSEREESKTDQEQVWQKPSEANLKLYPKGEPVTKIMFDQNPEKHTFKSSEEASDILVGLFQKHGLRDAAIFKSLTVDKSKDLSTVTTDRKMLDGKVKELLALPRLALSEVCTTARSPASFYDELAPELKIFYELNVEIDPEQVAEICEETLGQSINDNWLIRRENRITASRFHKIKIGQKKETRLKRFYEKIPGNKYMDYGILTEDEARRKYESLTGQNVLESGLVISPAQPWLACSPDGIIPGDEPKALEIKCPATCAFGPIVTDYIKDGKLKKSHAHYTQCQIQMYVLGFKKCDFFVYSKVDYILDHIDLDMAFL